MLSGSRVPSFNQVFRRKHPVIEIVKIAGGRTAAKEYTYCTDSSSDRFKDRSFCFAD